MSLRSLEDLLSRYPRRVQPLSEPEPLGGAGGLSGARLWRYRSEAGPLVVRAWPPHGPGRAHLERVHRWLSRAGELGFIPVPIPDRGGRTLQEYDGRFWELAPWLAGAAEPSHPPPPARVRSAFAALAALHRRLAGARGAGTSPGLRYRYEAITSLVQGGLDRLERAIGRAGGADPEAVGCRQAARRWVELARLIAPRLRDPLREAAGRIIPLQPCLRDARPAHFLFDGDRLSGLVDFGAMGVDSVAGDLARLMGEWLDDDPAARAEALAAYERVRPLDAAESALIIAFESASALLIGEHWIRWHYLEGRCFDDPQAVTAGMTRGLRYLERFASRGEAGALPVLAGPEY